MDEGVIKNVVILGMPRRYFFRYILVLFGLMVWMMLNGLTPLVVTKVLLIFDRSPWDWLLPVIVIPMFLPSVLMLVLAVKMSRYEKRFKKLRGRVCFVCGYEIGEGLERCSECGAEWSLKGLNKRWRKMAEDR